MDKERARFLNAFAKVPDVLRSEIIVVVDGKPYNWNTAYFEIREKTPLSKKILNTLVETKLI